MLPALLLPAPALASAGERAETVRLLRSRLEEGERALRSSRLDEAETFFREALERAADLNEPNLLLARAVDGLADLHRLRGRHAEAETLYLRSVAMWERLLGERQPRLATSLHNLGVVLIEQDKTEPAERTLTRALAIWEATLGADSPEARNTRRALRSLR